MCQESARNILEGRWPALLPLGDRKNVDEIYWLDQLWNDSWRTSDPDKALVYVLPIYPVLLLHNSCNDRNRTKAHDLAATAVKEVRKYKWKYGHQSDVQVMETPQWKRNGGLDHILVASDWRFNYPFDMTRVLGESFATFAKNITQGRHLVDNHRGLFGCAVTIPHTSSLTPLHQAYQPFEKESLLRRGLIKPTDVFEDDRLAMAFNPPSRHDWFERDYTMFFQGKVYHDRPYRKLAFESLAGWHYKLKSCPDCAPGTNVFVATGDVSQTKFPFCPRRAKYVGMRIGKFERCEAVTKGRQERLSETSVFIHRLASSKLNLCFRGRDVTSSRVVDGFATRTIDVLISDLNDMYKYAIPLQCEIPWKNLTYSIEGSVFEQNPRAALKPILDELYKDHRAVTEKLRMMDYYSKKLLWDAPNSETARSVLRAMTRQCLTDKTKLDYIKRTSKDGTAANVRDHALFSECAFVDTSAKLEEQRKPCMTVHWMHGIIPE
ncbi:unnamed protein product [Vitrella brassicaformis CCMP3155]|uniref:Exostosin GT47 domain-containing protein n=1 Tax=Vitrella brassicaformis (strain CCMP3155) TaxID=1169540 RepID=A0A0G4GEE7_VITBC|nr:unnamed protein product [Vitrella brassicaformis CCMP3155]|eukprot:CEM27708.1 unnamed protein product [Vitrella brassicaformis CCMP3155]